MSAPTKLDHILYGAADLDQAVFDLEHKLGARATPGGSHPGLGTRNALISLGERRYLEIVAPDPAQDLSGNIGAALLNITAPGLVAWCAATSDLNALRAKIPPSIGAGALQPQQRTTPGGVTLHWTIMHLPARDWGPVAPFFIDWRDTPHPTQTLDASCTLRELTLHAPNIEALTQLMSAIELDDVAIVDANAPALSAKLDSPNGIVPLEPARGW